MVPLEAGRFDLDTYIDYLIEMFQALGPDLHAGHAVGFHPGDGGEDRHRGLAHRDDVQVRTEGATTPRCCAAPSRRCCPPTR
jgi:hypothetical protein